MSHLGCHHLWKSYRLLLLCNANNKSVMSSCTFETFKTSLVTCLTLSLQVLNAILLTEYSLIIIQDTTCNITTLYFGGNFKFKLVACTTLCIAINTFTLLLESSCLSWQVVKLGPALWHHAPDWGYQEWGKWHFS